jgi:hypothetical protein
VFLTCELCTPTRWFNTVLATSIHAIITVGGGTAKVEFLIFWGLGVSLSLPSTLFYFLTLPFFLMVFYLRLIMCVSPTVELDQSTRDDLPVILCKVLESSPCVTILLRMVMSLWVFSSSSNGSPLDQLCSIQSRIRFYEL